MKINKNSIVKGLHTISRTVGKHSPLILTVAGVVGLGATAAFSYKSAKKVEVIVEEMEYIRDVEEKIERLTPPANLNESTELAELQGSLGVMKLDRIEIGKRIIGAVALPVVTGLASVTAIALSYHIQNNRIVNLAATLATATAERAYFHNKYKDVHGEEEYKKFSTPTRNAKATKIVNGKVVEVEGNEKIDIPSLHGEWFDKSTEYTVDDHDYNMAFIRSVEDNLNLRLFRKGYLLMNEVYDALGLQRTRTGAMIGWSTGTGFNLYPEVTECLNTTTGEVRPQIYIKWTSPTTIYDTIEFETSRGSL